MNYKDLPKDMISPITGNTLIKMKPRYPNGSVLSVNNRYDIYDYHVVIYLNEDTGEHIYIPYEHDGIDYEELEEELEELKYEVKVALEDEEYENAKKMVDRIDVIKTILDNE